jgi:hypothetical protein
MRRSFEQPSPSTVRFQTSCVCKDWEWLPGCKGDHELAITIAPSNRERALFTAFPQKQNCPKHHTDFCQKRATRKTKGTGDPTALRASNARAGRVKAFLLAKSRDPEQPTIWLLDLDGSMLGATPKNCQHVKRITLLSHHLLRGSSLLHTRHGHL